MNAVDASTRQRIVQIAALVDNHRMEDAEIGLYALIKSVTTETLALIAPELNDLIGRFYNKRRKGLYAMLEAKTARIPISQVSGVRSARDALSPKSIEIKLSLGERYAVRLVDLRNKHIFKWIPFYRDAFQYMFKDSLIDLSASSQWYSEFESVGNAVATHAYEIFGQGFRFQVERGLTPELSEIKSVSGLQTFLYLIVSIFMDQRETIQFSKQAEITWALTSSLLSSIVRGYGRAHFGTETGWTILRRNLKIWLAPLGFCRGSDVQSLLDEFPDADRDSNVYVTVVPTLLAVERLANRFHEQEIFLPRLSRLSVSEPARLDVTLSVRRDGFSRELLVSTFFNSVISHSRPIADALASRATIVVACLEKPIQEWAEQEQPTRVLDAQDVKPQAQQVHNFSELVGARLADQSDADVASQDPTVMSRNYAADFPLEEPNFRKQFLVERHSVRKLLEEFEGSTGVHLWCSVRRSGKTTAATSLADSNSQSIVVLQTMDHQPLHPEQNIFERRLTEVLNSGNEIGQNFFQSVVNECILASTSAEIGHRRTVFLVDEYETLFGKIEDYLRESPALKFKIALPLLSQMVGFAANNLLIFMGQRPDAYLILPAQNQLSPLVKQYNVPLFEHIEGATGTEFTQFLRRVLTDRLPFDAGFSDAVFGETSGHPYLTVNLMVDFCDWMITNNYRINGTPLESSQFVNFVKARLTSAALKRSPYYKFFRDMLSQYASERGRIDEPWLSAITRVLQEIARKHPKAFACAINSFEQLAAPHIVSSGMTAGGLETSGTMSNFLQCKGGLIMPGVRLMARLAGAAAPQIN